MKTKTLLLVVTVGFMVLSMPLGCDLGGDASDANENGIEACPDTSLTVEEIRLYTLDDRGNRLFGTVFDADTPEILCSFAFSAEVCCTTVYVHLDYKSKPYERWGYLSAAPSVQSFKPAGERFEPGEYTVTLYIGMSEVASTTFIVT